MIGDNEQKQIPRSAPAPEAAPSLELLERNAGSGAQGARDDIIRAFFHDLLV